MASLIEFLIPKIGAQSSDAISQPTFGAINISPGSITTSSILLNWANPVIKVGDKFTVKVELKTGDFKINEYKIVLTYNKDFLTVVDKDTATVGTQVRVLDQLLTIATPASGNVAADGVITVNAKAPSGADYQINKEVVEIEFQAQKVGTSKIQVLTTSSGSRLTRLNGQPLSFNINEIGVNIATATSTNTNNGQNGNPTTPNNNSNQNVTPTPTNQTIPNTALSDGPGFLLSLALGLGFIATGFSFYIKRLFNRNSETE